MKKRNILNISVIIMMTLCVSVGGIVSVSFAQVDIDDDIFVPPAPTPTPAPTRLQVWGWNFGGSLADLVNQTGLTWWPGLAPLQNVGVEINVGDPFTLGYVSANTMMALPPVTAAQPTR